jgi:hypothetical protein
MLERAQAGRPAARYAAMFAVEAGISWPERTADWSCSDSVIF